MTVSALWVIVYVEARIQMRCLAKPWTLALAGCMLALVCRPAAAQEPAVPPPGAAQAPHPSTVTLASGDRATGILQPSDSTALHLASTRFGDLRVPWTDIVTLVLGDDVTIGLTDGRTVEGRATFEPPSTLDVVAVSGVARVDLTRVKSLAWIGQPPPPAPTWKDRWAFSGGSQLHASRGNSGETDFGLDFSVTRQDAKNRLGIYGNRRFSNALNGDSYARTSDEGGAGVRVDRSLSPRLLWFASADVTQDRFQQIRRLWVSGGIGLNVLVGDARSLTLTGGVSRGRDQQLTAVSGTGTVLDGHPVSGSRTYDELQVGNSLMLEFANERFVITQDLTVYSQIGSASVSVDAFVGNGASSRRPITGNLRCEFSASLKVRVLSMLSWQVGVQDSYNRQPYQGVKSNDVTVSSGLTFALGKMGANRYGGTSSNVGRRR